MSRTRRWHALFGTLAAVLALLLVLISVAALTVTLSVGPVPFA